MLRSPLDSFSKISVAAHDAGGAEMVSGHIKRNGLENKCRFSLKGPAIEIFHRKFGAINNERIEKILPESDCLFSSTSWDSSHEFNAIKKAKILGLKTITFLDHWVNYRERFSRDELEIFPDEIWVSDNYALEIAKNIIGNNVSVYRIVENPYLLEAKKNLVEANKKIPPNISIKSSCRILFLSEAISEHAMKSYGNMRHWGYTQIEALNYLIENINSIDLKIQALRIRPHPSESSKKFLSVLGQHKIRTEISISNTLWEDIAWANVLVGCNSMAMVAGLALKKRVICSIPPGNPACKLPFPEIESLENIIKKLKINQN